MPVTDTSYLVGACFEISARDCRCCLMNQPRLLSAHFLLGANGHQDTLTQLGIYSWLEEGSDELTDAERELDKHVLVRVALTYPQCMLTSRILHCGR